MKTNKRLQEPPKKGNLRQDLKSLKVLITCQTIALLILSVSVFKTQININLISKQMDLFSRRIGLINERIDLLRISINLSDEHMNILNGLVKEISKGIIDLIQIIS